jgi:uncharacterized membrane protein YhhN
MTKQTKITIVSILFILAVVIDVFAVVTRNELLESIFKPLLMSTLVSVYLVSSKKSNFWYVSALFFSFWGDVLLLFNELFFVYGLAAFLIAHILFIKITKDFLKKPSPRKIVIALFPFVVFFLVLLYLIENNLNEMLIPVVIYGAVISVFGAITFLNYLQKRNTENLWLFLGAVIFIVSDSMIALNKFYEPQEMYSVSIMITYIVAQYLICKSLIVKTSHQ